MHTTRKYVKESKAQIYYTWPMIVMLLRIHEVGGGRLVGGPLYKNHDLENRPTEDMTG
jgi:hypothetical protein